MVNYREVDAAERIASFAGRCGPCYRGGARGEREARLGGGQSWHPHYHRAAEASDPVLLPVRACMTANVTMKFVLIYAVPMSELERAANGIT